MATLLNKDFITRAGLRVEGTTIVSSSTNNAGAVQINSGIAVAGNMIVGSTATFYGPTTIYSSLNVAGIVSATNFYGLISTATNIAGGSTGSIAIQSAGGVTAFIPLGTNGQVLLAGVNTASWNNLSSISVGLATTATNLLGGSAGVVPYQSASGVTQFTTVGSAGNPLVSNGTAAPTFQNYLTLFAITATYTLNAANAIFTNASANNLNVTTNVTATTFYGNLVGTASSATTATNLLNGLPGSIPIQSGTGTTAFIPLGLNGQVLLAGNNTATWNNLTSLSVGLATTATNLAGGIAGVIPYQNGTGSTVFTSIGLSGQPLVSGGNGAPTFVSTITLSVLTATSTVNISGTAAATSTSTGALTVLGGVGIAGALWAQQIIIPNNGLFTVNRAGGQYFTIEDDDITFNAILRSYSSPNNAKSIYYDSRTDTIPTTATAGSLGHIFEIQGQGALLINWSTVTNALAGTQINGNIQSTASNNGTLVVQGGAGISQNLYVGGTIYGSLAGTANTATTITGGVAGAILFQSATNVTSFSSTGTIGQVLLSGGTGAPTFSSSLTLAVLTATTLNVTGNATVQGSTVLNAVTATVTTVTQFTVINNATVQGNTVLNAVTATLITGTQLTISGTATAGNLIASSNNNSIGQGTGALQVTGGAYIGGSTYIGSTTYITGDLYVDGTQFTVNKSFIATGDLTITLGTGTTSSLLATNAGLQIGTTSSPWITWLFDGSSNWVSSNGIKVNSTVSTNSTNSGALQVAGGVGIGGSLFVSNYVTATYHIGYLGGPTSAIGSGGSNLYGGATGQLHYQSAANTTAFLSTGSQGQILEMFNGIPTWVTVSGLSAGYATTASNLAGGAAYQIPIQQSSGTTFFSTGLQFNPTGYNNTSGLFSTTNISIYSGYNSTSTVTGSLTVVGGVGIGQDVYVGGSIYVGGEKIGGNTGTFVNVSITGTGVALTVTNNVWVGGTVVINSTLSSTSTTASNALYVVGGIGANTIDVASNAVVGGNLYVTGNITGTNVVVTVITGTNGYFYGDNTGNGALYAGIPSGYTYFGQTIIQASGNYNGYMELNLQNVNSGTQSSGDIIVSADNVTASAGYIDMGITGSKWDGTQPLSLGTALGPNDGYVMMGQNTGQANQPGDLVFGTTTTGTQIRFVVAATATQVTTSDVVVIVNKALTPTLSTTTATVVVYGGLGIGGNIYFSGNLYQNGSLFTSGTTSTTSTFIINNPTPTNGTTSGALVVLGGVGIGGGLYVGGTITGTNLSLNGNVISILTVTNVTSATSTNSGAVQVYGGVGIGGALWVGTTSYVANAQVVTTATIGQFYAASTSSLVAGTYTVSLSTSGVLTIPNTLAGASNTGSVVISSVYNVTTSNWTFGYNGTTGTITFPDNTNQLSAWAPYNQVNITNTNSSTSTTTGALTVAGGVGISGNLYQSGIHVIQSTASSTSTTTGALQVAGGIGVGGNANIYGTLTVGPTVTGTSVTSFLGNNFAEASYTSNLITSSATGQPQLLDTFSTTTYRTAEYMIQITDTGTNPASIHVEKLLIFQDGGFNIYDTEYAIMTNNGELGTFTSQFTGTNVGVYFTPAAPVAMTIKMVRFALTL